MDECQGGDWDDLIVDDDVEQYRKPGVFASGTGDLIPRILANILKAPLVVISSGVC